MLERIDCDKFIKKSIIFHNGFNAILGDDIASNSIGKSTLLMIIDFVFGGNDYITKNNDAIEQLGHHTFKFIFNFNNRRMFFMRSTNNSKVVSICNDKFEEIENPISTKDYTLILQREYGCELEGLSFRDIIGRYFRVYGKENLVERKPIQYFDKELEAASILALVKLFDKYKIIESCEKELNELKEEKTILRKAAKKDLIPNITKSVFTNNTKKIDDLSKQLENLKIEIISSTTDVEVLISKEILNLKKEKSKLLMSRNVLDTRQKRVFVNLENKNINFKSELEQFRLYFHDFDFEKVNKVDSFHSKLTKILKKELQSTNKDLEERIKDIDSNIKQIDEIIVQKLNIQNAPKFAVDKVVELAEQINQLKDENGYFSKQQSINENLSQVTKDLAILKEKILNDICSQINARMYELNKFIYEDKRRAPTLNIQDNKYAFSTYGDTGTGTAFANLITFDLALLELTCLPAIAHDLPLLKNIENPAMEKIIELYAKSKKQIFIAIDKINSYDKEAVKIVESHSVIHLSKDKTLFIKNWKNNT